MDVELEQFDIDVPLKENINSQKHRGIRPLCPCCGGGEVRKGYSMTKYKSNKKSKKARKPRYKDHRK